MKTPVLISFFIFIFMSKFNYAQLTVKDSNKPQNTLLQVIDEGSAGSILLPSVGSTLPGTKLYNNRGSLFWGTNKLGFAGSSGGWTDGGSVVYTTSSSDKVAIGTTDPIGSFTVMGNDGVIFLGTFGGGSIPLAAYVGTRMMWTPNKASFRFGRLDSGGATFWDDDSIGEYSFAGGYNVRATGLQSIAMGGHTRASAWASIAIGYNTQAIGQYSTSMGNNTAATGSNSTAMNYLTKAESYCSTVIGRYNVGGGRATGWEEDDPLFEIGNGTSSTNKSNALTVLKNGKIGVEIESPAYKLQIHEKSSNFSYMSFSNETTDYTNGNGVLVGLDATEDFRIHSYEENNIKFYINNSQQMIIDNNGNVGIGTPTPSGKLDVDGAIYQRGGELHADYVFEDEYELESIKEHSEFMWREKHLPAIPKAKVDEQGREIVEVGSHRRGIVEELEKAHIYISQLEERLAKLEKLILDGE